MRSTSYGGSFREGEKGMYAQGLATMALSEAFVMTKRSDLTGPILDGVEYIQKARHSRGGWLYEAGYPGDMLVTGWELLTLLGKAFAVTRKSELARSVIDGVDYIEKAQHSRGGWRYEAGYPGDMLVTGWQLLALKSAQRAGVEVDEEVLRKVDRCLLYTSDAADE